MMLSLKASVVARVLCLALVFGSQSIHIVHAQEAAAYDKSTCETGAHEMENMSPDPDPVAPEKFYVEWATTASDDENIVLEVTREWSPNGVDRFYKLIQDNYYNCATFFRVVPDFVVQLGIASDPDLTDKWNTKIPDDPVLKSNLYGYVSFATSGPDTRTAQIFINTADNEGLDDQGFSPFAQVIQGMDVIENSIYNPTPGESSGADQTELSNFGNARILQEYPDIDLIKSTQYGTGAPGGGGASSAGGVIVSAQGWSMTMMMLSALVATVVIAAAL